MDGLTAPAHLGAWLRDIRPRLSTRLTDAQLLACTAEDLAAARDLRDCVRALADVAVYVREDALQLQIHYDRPDQARFRLVLTDDAVPALAASTVTDAGATDHTGFQAGP